MCLTVKIQRDLDALTAANNEQFKKFIPSPFLGLITEITRETKCKFDVIIKYDCFPPLLHLLIYRLKHHLHTA